MTPESMLPLPPATFHILMALTDEDRAWLNANPVGKEAL